jgi:hypothetical protein
MGLHGLLTGVALPLPFYVYVICTRMYVYSERLPSKAGNLLTSCITVSLCFVRTSEMTESDGEETDSPLKTNFLNLASMLK